MGISAVAFRFIYIEISVATKSPTRGRNVRRESTQIRKVKERNGVANKLNSVAKNFTVIIKFKYASVKTHISPYECTYFPHKAPSG